MSTLHFLNYNNYQNRVLKGEALTSTSSYSISKSYSNLNFNPNDGVDTVHYINDPATNSFNYDYCLVTNDDSTTILSKWFVMDAIWNRKHQWEVTLKRDVKADLYDEYKSKPFFCKKGVPYGTGDVLCFNSEGQDFNQILKSRTALKQTSGQTGRYIIGFVDKKWNSGEVIYSQHAAEYASIEDLPFKFSGNSGSYVMNGSKIVALVAGNNTGTPVGQTGQYRGYYYEIILPVESGSATVSTLKEVFATTDLAWQDSTQANWQAAANYLMTNRREIVTSCGAMIDNSTGSQKNAAKFFSLYNGKPILIGDKIYTFTRTTTTVDPYFDIPLSSNYKNPIGYALSSYDTNIAYNGTVTGSMLGGYYRTTYNFSVTVQNANKVSLTPPTGLLGRPYNIFVIPDSAEAREFAGQFASQYAGGNVLYDLQLFPYTPPTTESGSTTITSGVVLKWATNDSRTGTCSHDAIASYSSMSDKKVGANQHMCRMISPNGASAWEFNPATIGGVAANSIKYEFTLIPFNSYLHLFPTFGGIYGSINKSSGDTNGETRGMVCSGPWSLPYSTDNWSTYQLNNSAYMDSFNRQIENMTVTQDIDRAQQMFQMFTAPITGMFMGAMGGGVAGAALGAGAGLIGSVADYQLSEVGRKETIDYTKDQFYNSLRNIKAQARPLAHNSSITIGNSYWPIIEYYEADVSGSTDMRDYLLEDLRVHGWTMGIKTTFETMKGRASSSTSNYIQGHLLQINNSEDTHIANEVMKELEKGVYINGI